MQIAFGYQAAGLLRPNGNLSYRHARQEDPHFASVVAC